MGISDPYQSIEVVILISIYYKECYDAIYLFISKIETNNKS